MTFTPPPPAPTSTDPVNFDARADALMSWFATHVQEQNNELPLIQLAALGGLSASAAMNATDYVATSASPLNVNAGAKTVTLQQTGKGFANGDQVVITRRSNSTTRMYGALTGAPTGTGNINLPVNVTAFEGSGGPFSDWVVSLAALADLPFSASPAQLMGGATDKAVVTPKSLRDAAIVTAQTFATSFAPDFSSNVSRSVVLTSNASLIAPIGCKSGQMYALNLFKTGGNWSASWSAAYQWGIVGAPSLSVAGTRDVVFLYCVDENAPTFVCSFWKEI